MRIAIVIAGGLIALAIAWLALGNRIVFLFDRCFPGPPSAKDLGAHMEIAPDKFGIAGGEYPISGVQLIFDSQKRIVIYADGRAFTLGPIEKMWIDPGNPFYLFVPEPDDVVTFRRDVSRLEWHTPFAWSLMSGTAPKRHRYAYDRLRWRKSGGAVLEIIWWEGQAFHNAWKDEYDYQPAKLNIRPGPPETAAAAYLAATKKWAESEYEGCRRSGISIT